MNKYIEVHIKEYRRKDGTFVRAHSRTIKKRKELIPYIRKTKNYNPHQLMLDLSGGTKTHLT